MLENGAKVVISNLSTKSYHLFKGWQDRSPYMECPCHFKKDVVLTVEENMGTYSLLSHKDKLTLVYNTDLTEVK